MVVLVGSLNCLGEAFNPFEFLSSANLEGTELLQSAAEGLTWEAFAATCGERLLSDTATAMPTGGADALARLREHCNGGHTLWSFFDEPTLEKDNKLLEGRLNLLQFAMRGHGDADEPQWLLLERWVDEMAALVETHASQTYASDPNLWLWDLTCNSVASAELAAFQAICQSSYLNPSNFQRNGERLVGAALEAADAAEHGTPLVLGMQGWPRGETLKGRAFAAAATERELRIVVGAESVACLHSAALGEAAVLDTSVDVTKAVLQQCLDAAAAAGAPPLEAKATAGLENACRKLLAVRFPAAPPAVAANIFLVSHPKEPKSEAAAHMLADVLLAIGRRAAETAGVPPANLVVLADTNCGSTAMAAAFAARLAASGFDAQPPPEIPTTAKQRSILHGQCYDTAKCLKLVVAPKDKIITTTGLSGVGVVPNVAAFQGTALPSDDWPADHALIYARLVVGGTGGDGVVVGGTGGDGAVEPTGADAAAEPKDAPSEGGAKKASAACAVL